MEINKHQIGDRVEFYSTYEGIMDGKVGTIENYSRSFFGTYYTVKVGEKLFHNVSEDEIKPANRIYEVKLEAKQYNCIMQITNDFILWNVLPKYNLIKINTHRNEDGWVSEIEYTEDAK